MSEVHVIPDDRTTWRVYDVGAPPDSLTPLSEHTNATDAEVAALAWADDRGADRVVIHDRYHRTHDADASAAGRRARAQRARSRELDTVRQGARRLTRVDALR